MAYKSTFNLPDISDCFIQGGTPGTTNSAGLPNITGGTWISDNSGNPDNIGLPSYTRDGCASGAFYVETNSGSRQGWMSVPNNSTTTRGYKFDASRSSNVYGNSTTVQPKSVEMNYCIKF